MKFSFLKSVLALAAIAIGSSACSDKGYWEPYTPEGVEYAFQASNLTQTFYLNSDEADRYLTLTIRRNEPGEATTLPLTVTSVSNNGANFFEVPSEVTFEQGAYAASFKVMFLKSTRNVHRKITVSFPKEDASLGGSNECALDCMLINPPKD